MKTKSEDFKIHINVTINAPVEKVYNTMLDKKTYSEWTSEFNPDSYYEGSWARGSRILFLGTDPNGKAGGMVGRIRENIPNAFLSIEYLGIIKDDKEILSGPEVEDWVGNLENYSFKEKDGITELTIDVDSNEELKAFFEETWPKALDKLKALCENK